MKETSKDYTTVTLRDLMRFKGPQSNSVWNGKLRIHVQSDGGEVIGRSTKLG